MTEGFAFVAYPAEYRSSGVMTFIVNQDGIVYQKDLGKKTEALGNAMQEYNPDSSWRKVEEAGQFKLSSKTQQRRRERHGPTPAIEHLVDRYGCRLFRMA